MRSCNYKQGRNDDSDESPPVSKSGFSGSGSARRGRGRGGRGNVRSENSERKKGIGRVDRKKNVNSNQNCLVCDKDHLTSKCDTWRSKSTSKTELFAQAFNLSKKICTWCLEPGHMSFKCTCEEEVGCPCGSNFNMFICTKTPDCKSRKN